MINKILGPLFTKLPENNNLERIWVVAKTDFIKRYYGTSLGIFWALLNPLFRLLIYYTVFTVFFTNRVENFALYLFSGLLIWMLFTEGTSKGIQILKSKRFLIENIRINKLHIYYASVLSVLMGFSFNFLVYIIISLFFHVTYSWYLVFFPLLILMLAILIIAVQMILSIINIYLRDITHVWDMVRLLLFWANPIFYPQTIMTEKYPIIPMLNPIAGIIINTRNVILYNENPNIQLLIANLTGIIILFGIGLLLVRRFSHKAIENM